LPARERKSRRVCSCTTAHQSGFASAMQSLSHVRRHIPAALVAFVASPLSSATNGAALRVEGGVVGSIL